MSLESLAVIIISFFFATFFFLVENVDMWTKERNSFRQPV
jgi:YbbR domain-containing protein